MPDVLTPPIMECEQCGYETDDWYASCGAYQSDCCGPFRCGSCWDRCSDSDGYDDDEDDGYSSSIRDYSYRPSSWRPKGDYKNNPLLGLELEVGTNQGDIVSAVHQYDDSESHLILKHDSSITGAEIVTHPMTLAWAREDFDFDGLLSALRNNGCEVDNEYGLHIHVSRNAFRPVVHGYRGTMATHQLTWLLFIYRNSDALTRLARRDPSQWGSFTKDGGPSMVRKATVVPCREDRYTAVNCNNERTFELRFFASTLESAEFWAALEFADASVRYTATLKSADVLRGAITWPKFTAWVAENNYPNLLGQITGGNA